MTSMSWVEDPGIEEFEGLNISELRVDEAFVRVVTSREQLWLYTLSELCYKCPFTREANLVSAVAQEGALKYRTRASETWRLYTDGDKETIPVSNDSGVLCELKAELGEFGVYDLTVEGTVANTTCSLTTASPPVNIYLPLAVVCLGLFVLWLVYLAIWQAGVYLKRRAKKRYIVPTSSQENEVEPRTPEPQEATPPRRPRLKSLDTFRGISIIMMIFVNYGAGSYWFFDHEKWNGLLVADLLFPWFMWIMGVCIPISLTSQLKKNIPRLKILTGIIRRSVILFALGVILGTLGGNVDLEKIRVFGVLQRFGVAYLVVATMGVFMSAREYTKPENKFVASLQDVLVLVPQWVVVGGLVAGHTVITFLLEVPGCPVGYLGPGGLHEDESFRGCSGGATGYIDRLILGTSHIYQFPTSDEVYGAGPFDPEGILGCMTSVFQVFLGVQAGSILLFHEGAKARVTRWVTWGVITGVAAAILCLASKENGWIPVNKNMWSLSFVLVTSSFAFFLLTACYLLIDVKKWWGGAPFFYPGMNATVMYVGHELAYQMFPWHWTLGPMNTHFVLLIECLWGTALWILVAVWLHRIKFFLSI